MGQQLPVREIRSKISQGDMQDRKGENMEENCTEAGAGLELINSLWNDRYSHQCMGMAQFYGEVGMWYMNVWSCLKDKVSNHFQGWLAPDIEISGSSERDTLGPVTGWEEGWRSPRWELHIPRLSTVLCWANLFCEKNWWIWKDGDWRKEGAFLGFYF